MRNIAQQAGVYIESSSRSSDSQLTNDEIELLTSALVKVKTKNFSKDAGKDDKLIVTVTVQAEIDTEQTSRMLNELMMAKKIEADYKKLKTEYADAIKNYDRLKNQYKMNLEQLARHYIREGQCKERQGDLNLALHLYEKAIDSNPNYARAYSRRGHIYFKQKEFALAQLDYEKAESLDHTESGAHYGKAMLLEKQGKNEEAVEEYRKFVKYADIIEYDIEITQALDRMVNLFNGV